MKRIASRSILCRASGVGLVCLAFTSLAQTTSPAPIQKWLTLSDLHLRPETTTAVKPESLPKVAGPDLSSTAPKPANATSQPADPFSLGLNRDDADFYFRHQDLGLLKPPAGPHDPLSRGFDAVFRPEEFHLGRKATVSCSILTAIKRKNPLCLLNPIFLHVSW
jgi:hypothetical protein